MAELQDELDAVQKDVAALANQRDQQREISAILRNEHAEEMAKVDEAYADTRELWAVFEPKRQAHEAAVQVSRFDVLLLWPEPARLDC